MKKNLLLLAVALMMCGALSAQTKKVGLLIGSESVSDLESGDEKKAAEWFQSAYPEGVVVTPSTLDAIDEVSTLWVAIDRIGINHGWTNLPEAFRTSEAVNAIAKHVKAGGTLLLTNHATQLVTAIGRIEERLAPGIFGNGPGEQNDDTWGVHPIIGNEEGQIYDHTDHAIYAGLTYQPDLFAGIYCFESAGVKGNHNCMWDLNAYGLVGNPNVVTAWEELTNSTVLGTWNHVVDYCCAGIVDFAPTTTMPGRILAVGLAAYEWDMDGGVNSYQDQLELFTQNSIGYLLDNADKDLSSVDPGDGPIVVPTDDPATEPMAAVEGKVGLLIGFESVDNIFDDDEWAAADWFQKKFTDGIIITPSTLNKIADVNTLWVPIDRTGIEMGAVELPEPFCDGDVAMALADHVKAGGSLLLTNHATQLLPAMGRIDFQYAPNIFGAGEGGDNNDVWGINAQIGANVDLPDHYDHSGHVIFTGLAKNNTLYSDHSFFPMTGAGWKEDHNCMWDFNAEAYALEDVPNKLADFEQKTSSTVLGAWQHVTDYACAGLIEFLPTDDFAGTIIANGLAAYEWSQNTTTSNEYQVNVEYLTWNCLNYLNSKSSKTLTATAIRSANTNPAAAFCYDLQGRRMDETQGMAKGLYIVGNKKYIVK